MNKELVIDAKKSFIGGWFIEDVSLCDDIIMHFEQRTDQAPGEVWWAEEKAPKIDIDEKDSLDISLKLSSKIGQRYANELQKILRCYKIKYPKSDWVAEYRIEDINVQKYNIGGGYKKWHTERSGGLAPGGYRHLVFMTYLNDVDAGGETEFFHQEVAIKPRKGLTLIWPADWTHFHRGIPSQSEIKYIVTGWYTFTARN